MPTHRQHAYARAVRLACALAVASLTACASIVDLRVEQAIAEALPQVLGPADRYDVQVQGACREAGSLINVGEATVVGLRVRRPDSLVVDRVEATFRGVQIDRSNKTLTGLESADMRADVQPADVAAYLNARPTVTDAQVSFLDGDVVTVSLRPVIAGFTLPAAARVLIRGYLVPQDAQLRLNITDLRVAGFPTGLISTQVVERLINPLIDLSSLPAPTRITEARTAGSVLVIKARATRAP